jgi:hypothetical protein
LLLESVDWQAYSMPKQRPASNEEEGGNSCFQVTKLRSNENLLATELTQVHFAAIEYREIAVTSAAIMEGVKKRGNISI